jgi:hypothetical protein
MSVQRFGIIVSLTWRRLGTPLANEHIFFHLLDREGKIDRALDRRICIGCADPQNVVRWTERFYLDKTFLKPEYRIGVGVYAPNIEPPLKTSGGLVDWNGTSALFDLAAGGR